MLGVPVDPTQNTHRPQRAPWVQAPLRQLSEQAFSWRAGFKWSRHYCVVGDQDGILGSWPSLHDCKHLGYKTVKHLCVSLPSLLRQLFPPPLTFLKIRKMKSALNQPLCVYEKENLRLFKWRWSQQECKKDAALFLKRLTEVKRAYLCSQKPQHTNMGTSINPMLNAQLLNRHLLSCHQE